MIRYVGSKVINAKPMSRKEYNDFRGWELPSDENGADEGYLVEYLDGGQANTNEYEGYVSWSPKAVFDRAYNPSGQMTFGDAVLMAKEGHRVARLGWNGLSMFAYIVPAGVYEAQTEAIKGFFPANAVPYRAYWALKTAQGDVATWHPSGSDSLAEDWVVVE